MISFRGALARRLALGGAALFTAVGLASILALRAILARQLDGTLLHLAEVEAQAGAATAGPGFQFHEGVLLGAEEAASAELIRWAELWTADGTPVVRSRNLGEDLALPAATLEAVRAGRAEWATHRWRGQAVRSVVYPLSLVGAAHREHWLQVAAPLGPLNQTLLRFSGLVAVLVLLATGGVFLLGWQISGLALRPTREITAQAEAISAGSGPGRITAHAGVGEFASLVHVLNSMLDRLGRAFELQRRFTADASHELRAPLTSLKGDIDVTLRRERSADEYRATLERCQGEVQRLVRLAGDLLALARTDAALPLEHRDELDLRELAGRILERLRPTAEARRIGVELQGPTAPVAGDALMVERIIENLMSNAVGHCREGGRVTILTGNHPDATLTVRDEGPGIAADHAPHIFERFYRADPARRRSEGTGLGLAIARAGAEAHGGRLEFLGNDPGAVFRLTLPAVPSRGNRSPGSPPG